MRIWEFVAEIIGWSIMCDTKHFEGARPWLGDFREAFKMANGDTRQVDALFFYCIKKITEIELDRESHATSASMAYADLKELHTDALTSLLKNCKLANGENLSELLLS
ncbi:unnamed protein product [Anisakis simplex]|uniref:Uncharacterized protein n=1 Tax=Anisakis simplex TaxID=6269 RepID=A0A0M3JIP7_ANISI|nr:unnamed protein product [Anisakis simplex]